MHKAIPIVPTVGPKVVRRYNNIIHPVTEVPGYPADETKPLFHAAPLTDVLVIPPPFARIVSLVALPPISIAAMA